MIFDCVVHKFIKRRKEEGTGGPQSPPSRILKTILSCLLSKIMEKEHNFCWIDIEMKMWIEDEEEKPLHQLTIDAEVMFIRYFGRSLGYYCEYRGTDEDDAKHRTVAYREAKIEGKAMRTMMRNNIKEFRNVMAVMHWPFRWIVKGTTSIISKNRPNEQFEE